MGKVAGNLGYIIAMLPDMLLGLFTGKTKSLGLKDNLLPIASIVAGLFVRNPLLKMLLMGLGGTNLLNKASKEILENRETKITDTSVKKRQCTIQTICGRATQSANRKPCIAGLHANRHNRPCTLYHTDKPYGS